MYYEDQLYHHGIKGQKWGVRRYQNDDGSYTNEGKKRYSSALYRDRSGRLKVKSTVGSKIGAIPGAIRFGVGAAAIGAGFVDRYEPMVIAGMADAAIGIGQAWVGAIAGYHIGEYVKRNTSKSNSRRKK